MKDKFTNLFSRKFLLSVLVVVGGIGTSLKVVDDPIAQIVGIIVACVAAVAYTAIEGHVDSAAIEKGVLELIGAIEKLEKEKTGDEPISEEVSDSE